MNGRVLWFDPSRGIGFIVPDDGGSHVFVHHSQLLDCKNLYEQQRVTFRIDQGKHGPVAVDVAVQI